LVAIRIIFLLEWSYLIRIAACSGHRFDTVLMGSDAARCVEIASQLLVRPA